MVERFALDEFPSGRDLLNGDDQLRVGGRLDNITRRAGVNRRATIGGVIVHGHDEHLHRWTLMAELSNDPQLLHQHHFVELEHPTLGKTVVEAPRSRLSRTPAQVRYSTPTLGRDSQHLLTTILGYSEEKISEVTAGGALG